VSWPKDISTEWPLYIEFISFREFRMVPSPFRLHQTPDQQGPFGKGLYSSLSLLILILAFALAPRVHSEELNLNETADTSTMVLDPLAFGLTVGGLAALSEDLRNESESFLELGLDASILIADRFNMGIQFNWLLLGQSKGGGLTFDYLLGKGPFRPFFGAGIGIQYMDTGLHFGDAFGIAGRGQVGILFDVMDEMQLRIRVPIYMIGNRNNDQLVGVDFSFLFSGPHRHTKVKKLTY
jgi:hypothetical protein